MFSRRTKCYFLRKNKLRKKYDIVLVVRVEIRHHHFINFFSECFENELMQNYSKIKCECQIMHFK
jgi:RNase P protein component